MNISDILDSIHIALMHKVDQTGKRPDRLFISSGLSDFIVENYTFKVAPDEKRSDVTELFGVPVTVYVEDKIEYYIGEQGLLVEV